MINAVIIDPRNDPRWDEFVAEHPYGTMYHLSSWCSALNKAFDYEPCYAIVESKDKIKSGIPMMLIQSRLTGNRLVSLPRTSYCDPLVLRKEEMTGLIYTIQQFASKNKIKCIEIKTRHNRQILEGCDFKCYDYFLNQIIELPEDSQELWRKFHRTCVQQRIAKASKAGVKIRFGTGEKDLGTFYQLHKLTTQDHSIPPRPFSYFKSIREAFLPRNLFCIGIAEVGQCAAAAALFFIFKDTLYYEFLGIDYTFVEISPAHLLLWETIKMACGKGLKIFDFGLSPPDNEGLATYKRRWGADEKHLGYFYYPEANGCKKFVREPARPKKINLGPMDKAINLLKTMVASKLYKHFG